jgi:polyhydroxyalkanoate synthesis regulator phasin
MGGVVLEEMRRLALFTSGVAELTRHRAEQIVKTMMSDSSGAGASAMVRQLVETSRHNRQELLRLIGAEIRDQVESLGLATARDLDRLERRVARLEERVRSTSARAKRPSAKRTGGRAKKTTSGKRTNAKKTPSKKTTGRSDRV